MINRTFQMAMMKADQLLQSRNYCRPVYQQMSPVCHGSLKKKDLEEDNHLFHLQWSDGPSLARSVTYRRKILLCTLREESGDRRGSSFEGTHSKLGDLAHSMIALFYDYPYTYRGKCGVSTRKTDELDWTFY